MARIQFLTVDVPTGVAAGAATPVGGCNGFTVSIEGAFTATYQLQISLDNSSAPAAASWFDEGAALTADGAVQVTKQAAWARWNCTAFTSGAPTGRLAGVV